MRLAAAEGAAVRDAWAAPAAAAAAGRAQAIDALRGLAILGMVLVAATPLGVLPPWMYHAQTPPPSHDLRVDVAGLTWPDLVFPFFLFTLGAAIPLALSRRLDAGAGYAAVLRGVLTRGGLLLFFAVFRQHFDSSVSGLRPERYAWEGALIGLAALCAIFTRLPRRWHPAWHAAVRAAGWATALFLFASVSYPDRSGFAAARIDIILLVLAYCAVLGPAVWLITRRAPLARLAVLAIVAAAWLAGRTPGWLSDVYAYDPIPWLYKPSFVHFLCAVIPGTIAGDLLVDWMRRRALVAFPRAERAAWTRPRLAALAALLVLAVPLTLAGVQTRHLLETTLAASLLCAGACLLARGALTDTEILVERLVRWGAFWLLLGLLIDPLDGGTKKVPETLAWFFQGAGLALFVLTALLLRPEGGSAAGPWRLLVDAGRNPMLAYVGLGMLVLPLLGLTGLKDAVESLVLAPWVAFLWSVVLTLLVAIAVGALTRLGLLWRA